MRLSVAFAYGGGEKEKLLLAKVWAGTGALSNKFPYSGELQKLVVAVCEMHGAQDAPFLHSKSIIGVKDN